MKRRKKLIFVAGVSTIIIYLLGLLTGYFVQVNVLSRTQAELKEIREEFQTYKENLENVQLEQLYLMSHKGELSCKILVSIMDEIYNKLSYFWSRLPAKLEIYERYSEIQPEYLQLKRDYTLLTIRAWLLSLTIKEKCSKDIIPALYFYSKDCETCINQSYVLDELKRENPKFSAFIVDYNLDEPIVRIIKRAYNITEVPSFIINEKVYPGYHNLTQMKMIIEQ
jgi:hypothetical protein